MLTHILFTSCLLPIMIAFGLICILGETFSNLSFRHKFATLKFLEITILATLVALHFTPVSQ